MVLEIKPRGDCLVWENPPANGDFERHVHLSVPMGCQAFLVVDGSVTNTFNEGGHDLDLKLALKERKNILILGAICDRVFNLPIGAGGIGFYDRKSKTQMEAGVHGECTCRVIDGLRIYRSFGKTTVTAEEVQERIRKILQQEIAAVLSGYLEENDYRSFGSCISDMSADIAKKYRENHIFFDQGIELVNFGLAVPVFSKASREDTEVESCTDEEWLRLHAAEETKKKCSRCGSNVDGKAKYCPICGTELK